MDTTLDFNEKKFLTLFALFYEEDYSAYPTDKGNRRFAVVHDMAQKMCYFLKMFIVGEFKDFSFSWNWSGPYSTRLDWDLQSLDEKIKNGADLDNINLTEEYKAIVIQVRKDLKVLDHGLPTSKVEWMEILSCLHYMKRFEYPLSGSKMIVPELLRRKPRFNPKFVEKAWGVLEECRKIWRDY
ncbi:MAG TPA: hypothetical protein VJY47_02160 [Candidatus Dojkabacteria bacterium]|nr:hypothetical protein [Candidatus Dojkabacteria bacterium]